MNSPRKGNKGGYRATNERLHRERMEMNDSNHVVLPSQAILHGQGEAEVVPGFQLAPHIKRFCEKWEAERPSDSYVGEWSGNNKNFMTGLQWLAQETKIHIDTIRKMKNGSRATVNLTQADALLTAMGLTELLGDEIQVVPNPNWSTERWQQYMAERGCV